MPAFTRRHYVEVARILSGVRDPHEKQRLAEEFARMFRQDNPQFDAERFSSAVFNEPARRAREQPYEDDRDDDLPDEGEDEWADFDLQSEMQEGIVIGDARRGGYAVSASGRSVGTYEDFDQALLAAERWMQSQQYWPNVFYVNDHGNVDLLALTPKIVKGKVIKVDSKIIKSWV